MTQELFKLLTDQPVMDGKTSLHIDEQETFKPYEEKYVKKLSKITLPNFDLIFISIYINIKTKGSNINTIYNGQKIFSDVNDYISGVEEFIGNLRSLIKIRHGETESEKLDISVADITVHQTIHHT